MRVKLGSRATSYKTCGVDQHEVSNSILLLRELRSPKEFYSADKASQSVSFTGKEE
jgi:hypothetical protein